MPRVDFRNVDEPRGNAPLPDGKYPCKVLDVEEKETQYGDAMWRVRFEVIEGDHEGRFVFDNLVFSAAARPRLKLFCASIGLDVDGEVNLVPKMICGKACRINVKVEPGKDGEPRNKVAFMGYEALGDEPDYPGD